MAFLNWISENPYWSFFVAWILVESLARMWSRAMRMLMVRKHGWPTVPNMDADGDLVYPDSLEE